MKTHYTEERVALYIEGELPFHEQAECDAHMLRCATCREMAEDLRSSQVLVKSLRGDAVSSSVLRHVRENVLTQMSRTERTPGWWRSFERLLFTRGRLRYALASAFVLAIAGVFVALMRTSTPAPVPENTALVPVAPSAPLSVAVQQEMQEKPKSPVPALREEQQPIMVNLFTDDPNIVIYWFIDGKGDME